MSKLAAGRIKATDLMGYAFMDQNDVRAAFETDFADRGALKSGEYLEEHIVERARRMATNHRLALIEVLREWLLLREEPKTMIAVAVVRELRVIELRKEVMDLKKEVEAGKVFRLWYARNIDKAISVLDGTERA